MSKNGRVQIFRKNKPTLSLKNFKQNRCDTLYIQHLEVKIKNIVIQPHILITLFANSVQNQLNCRVGDGPDTVELDKLRLNIGFETLKQKNEKRNNCLSNLP